MKKILIFVVLGIFLIGTLVFLSAQGFKLSKKQIKQVEYNKMNITDDFNTKINELGTKEICLKDGTKIVKNKKCEKNKKSEKSEKSKKSKYSLVSISDTNLIYQNSQGVIKIEN